MQWEHGKTYLVAFLIALVSLAVMTGYVTLEQGFFDLEAVNHAVPNTAVVLLGIVLLIGPLSRIYDVFDNLLKYRKDLGIMAFNFSLFHSLLIYFLYREHNPDVRFTYTNIPFVAGLAALLVLSMLLLYSFELVIRTISRSLWWKLQNWGVRLAMVLVVFHMVLLNYRGWWKWLTIGGTSARPDLPPLNLIVTIFVLFVLAVRLIDLFGKKFARVTTPLALVSLDVFLGGLFAWGIYKGSQRFIQTPVQQEMVASKPQEIVNLDESEVTEGVVVNMVVGSPTIQINTPIRFDFFVNEKPEDLIIPIEELGSLLGKPIHVVGVRDDMNEFFHIHPQEQGPGAFGVDNTFTKPGVYRLWSWIKHDDITYFVRHAPVTVEGEGNTHEKSVDYGKSASVDNYQVFLEFDEPIVVGQTTQFGFDFHDSEGNEIELEPYAGATIHVSVFKEDLSLFIHGHEVKKVNKSSSLYIYEETHAHEEEVNITSEHSDVVSLVTFPEPGIYRVWVDFRPLGIPIPEELSLHAGFYVEVH